MVVRRKNDGFRLSQNRGGRDKGAVDMKLFDMTKNNDCSSSALDTAARSSVEVRRAPSCEVRYV